jgi:hypothetical protein
MFTDQGKQLGCTSTLLVRTVCIPNALVPVALLHGIPGPLLGWGQLVCVGAVVFVFVF